MHKSQLILALLSLTLLRRAQLLSLESGLSPSSSWGAPSTSAPTIGADNLHIHRPQEQHNRRWYPYNNHTIRKECRSAYMALQAKTGVFVHAGRDAAVKIVDWNNESVAFKVGRRSNNARGGNFTAKLMTEVPLLMRYNNTEDAPLVKMRLEPCTVVDDDGATAGIPFYAVEGNIVQWASLSKKQGVFEHMAWCQKVKLALQLDESQEWLEREQLEYQSYNWDDRTGGNPKLQTGISIVDGGTFKMLDAGLVSQSDTEHWNKLRHRMEDRRYSSAAAKRIVDKLKTTGWAHGAPRMRRSNAKTLFADLLRVDSNQHHTCRPKNSSFDAQYVGALSTERSLWGRQDENGGIIIANPLRYGMLWKHG